MSIVRASVLFLCLQSCSVTRPDQDNFDVDASKGSIEKFVGSVSQKLNASVSETRLDIPDAEPGTMYELDGHGISVIIQSQGDDRCIAKPTRHTTYNQRRYYVDLVYRTSASPERTRAKEQLIVAATEAGLSIQPFKEC